MRRPNVPGSPPLCSPTLGLVQVMLAAALWSTVGVATELVPQAASLPQEALGMWRMLIGGAAILLWLVLLRPEWLRSIRRLELRRLLDFAASSAVFQLCLFKSFALLGVTATVFFTVCLPPVLAALAALAKKGDGRRGGQDRAVFGALSLAVAGLGVFLGWTPGGAPDPDTGLGLSLAVVGSVAFVIMTSAARALAREAGPMVVAGVGLSLSGLLMAAVGLMTGSQMVPPAAETEGTVLGLVAYLGLGPTALAYVLYCAGMARCRSAHVGLVASMIEPALAAVLAGILLHEMVTLAQFAGCLLLMLAMVVLWQGERRTSGAA